MNRSGSAAGSRRLHPHRRVGEGKGQVGQHGVADFRIERTQLQLQVLAGQHVAAQGSGALGDAVQQVGVHIRADPEAENAGAVPRLEDPFDQGLFPRLPHGRQAVGQEHHQVRTPVAVPSALAQPQCRGQRVADGRAAEGFEAGHELLGSPDRRGPGRGQLPEQGLRLGGKADDLEAVTGIQVVQTEGQGPAGLLQLAARHGAGGVHHEADVLGLHLFGAQARGGQQEEIALLAGPAEGQQADAQRVALPRKHQLEIGVGPGVALFPAHHGAVLPVAADLDLMRRAVEALQRLPALEGHGDRDPAQRGGAELLGVERVHVLRDAGVAGQQLGVSQPQALASPRRDGEDPQPEGPPPRVLQQGRVPGLAHDLFVDGPGLVGRQQLRLVHPAVDLHGQAVDDRAGRKRKQVGALQHRVAGIEELLVHGGGGRQLADLHAHLVVAHLKRREAEVSRRPGRRIGNHDQPVRAQGGGSGQRPREQPGGQQTRNTLMVHSPSVGAAARAVVRGRKRDCKKSVNALAPRRRKVDSRAHK